MATTSVASAYAGTECSLRRKEVALLISSRKRPRSVQRLVRKKKCRPTCQHPRKRSMMCPRENPTETPQYPHLPRTHPPILEHWKLTKRKMNRRGCAHQDWAMLSACPPQRTVLEQRGASEVPSETEEKHHEKHLKGKNHHLGPSKTQLHAHPARDTDLVVDRVAKFLESLIETLDSFLWRCSKPSWLSTLSPPIRRMTLSSWVS